jgi:hypothetical protein
MNGLVTEPSRILAGQSGLIELDNAMCKSPGLIEPRGGLLMYRNAQSVSANEPRTTYAQQWQGTTTFAATGGTTTKLRIGAGNSVMTLAGTNMDVRAEPFADRYVWTFANALRMLDSPTGGSAPFTRLPGAPRGPTPLCSRINSSAVADRVLAPDEGVAYRTVVARSITTALGDRVVYGPPSDRAVFWNTELPAENCDIGLEFNTANLMVGDELQIYRTPLSSGWAAPGNTSDPGDEMQLLRAFKITALTPGVTMDDLNGPETFAGPPLYTNSSQEGILEANERTRIANDVAYYNGMAFYGGSSRGQSKSVTCLSVDFGLNPYSVAVQRTTGVNTLKSLLIAADSTNANPTLTNCNPTVNSIALFGGLSVGQLINLRASDPETASTIKGRILSWDTGANTITIDANATATTVATNLVIWDWVGIVTTGGVERLIYPQPDSAFVWGSASGVFHTFRTNNAGADPRGGGSDMGRAWQEKYPSSLGSGSSYVVPRLSTAGAATYPYNTGIVLRWEWEDDAAAPGDSVFTNTFEVISSKPYAFSQQVGQTYGVNLCRSENDGAASRVAWSKVLQPEATPLLNYTDLGDSAAPVVRLVATNDRLWIFKTDGLWSCYGSDPASLTFQQVDPTCRMIKNAGTPGLTQAYSTAPWVARLGNQVFAWTANGVFSVSSGGVNRIDSAIETDIAMWTANYSGLIPGGGLWSAASITDDLVAFGLANVQGLAPSNTTGITFVFHVGSGTWSTWSQLGTTTGSLVCGSGNADVGTFMAGSEYGYTKYMNSPRDDYYATAYPIATTPAVCIYRSDVLTGTGMGVYSVDSAVGATVVYKITGTAPGIPVGSLIRQSNVHYQVIAVSGLTLTMDRSGMAAGTFDVLMPIPGSIKYSASTQGAPAIYKRFQRAYFGFQQLRGGLLFTDSYRIRGIVAGSSALTEYFPDTSAITTLPNAIGTTGDREFEAMRDIPTAQTQGTGLEVTLTMQQAGMFYAIDALSVSYEPASSQLGGRS